MENLLIDGFFQNLVKSPRLPQDEHEIVLHSDATWDPSTAITSKEDLKMNDEQTVVYIGQKSTKRPLEDLDIGTDITVTAPSKKIKLSKTTISTIECINID